jgi:hypothetical protein
MDAATQHQVKTPEEAGEFLPMFGFPRCSTGMLHEFGDITCHSAKRIDLNRRNGETTDQNDQDSQTLLN